MSDDKPELVHDRDRAQEPIATSAAPVARLRPPALPIAVPKRRKLGFERLARDVAKRTNNFALVFDTVKEIMTDASVEPRDRIKAAEFFSKWTEANPATVRHVVSGPDGKPIQHAHAHVAVQALPDLSVFTAAELDAYVALQTKLGAVVPQIAAPEPTDVGDVEDAEFEE